MTQEILDCLLIKAQFILLTTEELLDKMKTEEYFAIYCDVICNIMEHDGFFYVNGDIVKKLDDIVNYKRFDCKHSSEVVADINEMIGVINCYRSLSDDNKKFNTKTWIKQQIDIRKLPYRSSQYSIESIYKILVNEHYYADIIINKNTSARIANPFYLLGTINMLINQYPEVFTDGDILSYCYSLALTLQDKVFPKRYRLYSKMAKDVMHSLDEIEERLQLNVSQKCKFNIEKGN